MTAEKKSYSSKKMYCRECNEEIQGSFKFCTRCGSPVVENPLLKVDRKPISSLADDDNDNVACPRCNSSLPPKLESKIFETFDEVIDATGNIIKKNLLSIGESRNRDCKGYVVCDRCNDYYRLRPWDEPDDFLGICECGGNLRFKKEIWR